MRATLALGLALFFSLALWAEEQGTNLERISKQIESLDADFRELVAKLEQTQKEKDLKENELKAARAREGKAQDRLHGVQTELKTLKAELERLEAEISQLRVLWLKRARALYVYREREVLGGLVAASSQDLSRQTYYLERLRSFDHELADRTQVLLLERKERRAVLETKSREQEASLQKLKGERSAVEQAFKTLAKTNAEYTSQRAELVKRLTELKAQALRIETVVSSLTGADDDRKLAKKKQSDAPSEPLKVEPYDGPGLFRLKGSLALPVQGEVLRGFGKRSVRRLDDLVTSRGVEYRADQGEQVSAIAPGRVMHSGRMPAYGNIVILDHGKRYYSLYGRLERVSVKKGETVEKGGVIGSLGSGEEDRANFYFEIRKNGEAVNPLDYFKKL